MGLNTWDLKKLEHVKLDLITEHHFTPFDSYCENVSSGGHVPNQTTGVEKAWISQRRRPVHLEICTYLNEMSRNKKRALRVLDVGGGAFSFLSSTCQPQIVPDIADFRVPEFYGNKAEYNKYLHVNVAFQEGWKAVEDEVKINGEYDFIVAGHLLEDVRDCLSVFNMIISLAPEGYFEVPTKWQEAKRFSFESKLRGYPHHYTIFSIYNGALVAYPKFFWFSEDKFYDRIKAPKKYAKILGMRWKGQIKLRILNSGFGLHENDASMFKRALTCDDIDLSQTLKGKNQAQYLPIWLE